MKREVMMRVQKIKIAGLVSAAGLILALFFLAACGGGQISTTPTTQKKETVAPPPSEEELEGKESKLAWSYDPTGKKDPFKVPLPMEPPNPKTRYYLEQLWIDGIIVGPDGKNIAHIITPGNQEFFISIGDTLGANKGIVKEIKAGGIVVEEQFLDPRDSSKIRIVDKFLKMEGEGAASGIKKK